MKKVMVLGVVLAVTQGVFAYTFWSNGTGDRLWVTPGNWILGYVPTSTEDIDITSFAPNGPIVGNGHVATASVIPIGAYSPGATVTVEMQFGSYMTTNGWIIVGGRLGHTNTGKGVLNMLPGSRVNTPSWMAVGNGGVEGLINMSGGDIFAAWFGIGRDNDGVSVGHVQLDGGEIATYTFAMGSLGTLDITGGTLRVGGDVSGAINAWKAAGKITGYGSAANVVVDTGTLPGWTLVTAVPEPATMILLGFGSLALTRKRK